MSKKSKKDKKKELVKVSALHISYVLSNKYEIDDESGFWIWFFEDITFSETALLSIKEKDLLNYPIEHKQYISCILDEFILDADESQSLEIENDIFN